MTNTKSRPLPVDPESSRRKFMMLAGGAIVGSNLSVERTAHAFGADEIKIALIGCGKRGIAATSEALRTGGGSVRLVAIADVFNNQLHTAYRTLKGKHADQVDVQQRRFEGLQGYRSALACDLDAVILATPPGFRPLHFESAVNANKHVWLEQPVATSAEGVRRIVAATARGKAAGLAMHVGLQRRHEPRYRQAIHELHQGIIGRLLFARAYWNGSSVPMQRETPSRTDLEHELRNWRTHQWLSGDTITEHHAHNLDIINWLFGAHPVEAQGQCGAPVERGLAVGRPSHTLLDRSDFNQQMVEYTYPGGVTVLSQSRQTPGCWNKIGEYVHGANGHADMAAGKIFDTAGKLIWKCDSKLAAGKGSQLAIGHFFAALRRGECSSEVEYAAESTMTAILGRLATQSGKIVRWDAAICDDDSLVDVDNLESLQHGVAKKSSASV